jgi:hypothetical protein
MKRHIKEHGLDMSVGVDDFFYGGGYHFVTSLCRAAALASSACSSAALRLSIST